MEVGGRGAAGDTTERRLDVGSFRAQLERIRGVRSARVLTDPALAIRIVATGTRSAEEIAADVKSLAAAAFDLLVGAEDVSVSIEASPEGVDDDAPRLAWLNIANEGESARIDVGVAWQGTETAGGAVTRSGGKKSRALAAAQAVTTALDPQLARRGTKVTVSSAETLVVSGHEWVVIAVDIDDGQIRRPVLGSALLGSDAVAAGAQALLDAMNRVLS